ncbi:MAG: zinc-binding dehydrogenase [Spartobacteria bacterium]
METKLDFSRPEKRNLCRVDLADRGGKLNLVVTQVFPLAAAAKAQEQIATRHTRGKIVLRASPDPKS